MRWFENEKIPHEVIDKAVEVASLSPSACNRQPYRFMIYDETNMVKKLSALPGRTNGYGDNIPVMIAVVGDLSACPFERDRHLIYIDASLAAMSFTFALDTQGVSSCIINWPDISKKEKQINKLLNLKYYEKVIMLIGIGYPNKNGKVAYSKKKNLEHIRQYNTEVVNVH